MGTRGILIGVVLLAATAARAQEPPGHETRHQIAERHCGLADKLEAKKHLKEAFFERLIALEMDPTDFEARTKLGYKKDENKVWRGNPTPPAAGPDKLDPKLIDEILHVRKDSAIKLMALAKQLRDDNKPTEARYMAGLALEEEPSNKQARDMLGHEPRGEWWVSPREARIRAGLAKALSAAKGGDPKPTTDQPAIEKLCGLGPLERRESEHGVLYWSKGAPQIEADALLRAAETAWVAHRYFVSGDDKGMSVEGDPKREATGGLAAPTVKPAWLVVAEKEHPTFIESALPDKAQHNFAKNLAGWQNWYKVPSGQLLLFEGCFKPTVRFEWVTGAMAEFLTLEPLGKRGTSFPEFLQEGLKRFFSGHVSGRAEIFYANTGSSTSRRSFESGTLDTLRSHVRRALQQAPEGELRALMTKKTNDLDQLDSAIALAFFDFLLAKQRGELAAFLAELKESEGGIATFERVMKKSVEDVEAAFRVWVREEY